MKKMLILTLVLSAIVVACAPAPTPASSPEAPAAPAAHAKSAEEEELEAERLAYTEKAQREHNIIWQPPRVITQLLFRARGNLFLE